MTHSRTAGGAAGAGGFSFQDSVAAWAAVGILAERAVTPRWGLEARTFFTEIRCETGLPVDDLMVVTSAGGAVYLQVKRSLRLSKSAESDLASAVDQFVRQFLAQRSTVGGQHPWQRHLDQERDRLVLMTDGRAAEWARVNLPAVLDRFRRDLRRSFLVDAAKNAAERDAAEILSTHARSRWLRACGLTPSTEELRDLFALIRIDCLDLRIDQTDGVDDASAIERLRQSVLEVPEQAENAYILIKSYCRGLAVNRSGSDRGDLQKELLRHGVTLRPALGMEADLGRLRQQTQLTLGHSTDLSVIEMDGRQIKIERPVVSALVDAVRKDGGNCLVVGEPGAGKSGVLHNAVNSMLNLGWDVVFLAADLLGAESPGELRSDLGTEHDLTTLLEQWDSPKPGVLVVDALDAARAERAARVLREVMRQVVQLRGRWRVVASIRKYDLRCSTDWQDLFRGSPVAGDFVDPEFRRVRHLNVPPLDVAELTQVAKQALELGALLDSARGTSLYDLLRQPFNLRLGAALLSDGLALADLTPLRTQIELLDRYWDRRVMGADSGRFERQSFARSVCEAMIQRQALRVPMGQINVAGSHAAIHHLMSQGVLSQPTSARMPLSGPDSIAFTHHVLFDYAVARTLLGDESNDLAHMLGLRPGLVLFIRPSLSLHFQHLWLEDDGRVAFWRETLRLLRESAVPRVGQLVGPEVAVQSARTLEDLAPLLDGLRADDELEQVAAARAIEHVVGALLASGLTLVGVGDGLWANWVGQLSRRLTLKTVGPVRILLGHLVDKIPDMTEDQRRATGMAGRHLLRFAEQEPRVRNYVYRVGIAATCRTFDSDPDDSSSVIDAILKPGRLDSDRVEALVRIAHEVRTLVSKSPDFTARVYEAVLQADEAPDDMVPLIGGRILSLNTSLRDLFKIAEWDLAEAFPLFLEAAPLQALRVLTIALDAFVRGFAAVRAETREYSFLLRGRQARFIADASCIWDEGTVYAHEPAVRMLGALQGRLEAVAGTEAGRFSELLDLVAETQSKAVVWRRVIRVGAEHAGSVGELILPIVEADVVLVTPDTYTEAGRFLSAVFPLLDAPSRRRIEEVILRLPASDLLVAVEPTSLERMRDRLLGCLSPDDVVTEPARQRLREMYATQSVPPNDPVYHSTWEWAKETDRDSWERSGLPYDDPQNIEFRRVLGPAREFASRFLNDIPAVLAIADVVPALRELADFLQRCETSGLHADLTAEGMGHLAACFRVILRNDAVFGQPDVIELARSVMLSASEHGLPVSDSESNQRFDRFPSRGASSPRVEAAQGLMLLARDSRGASAEVLEAIERLARDSSNSVRFMVAHDLCKLNSVAPELMWRFIDSMTISEPSTLVLFSLAHGTLDWLLVGHGAQTDRVVDAVVSVLDRVSNRERNSSYDALNETWKLLLRSYVQIDHPKARDILLEITRKPLTHAPVLTFLCACLRDALYERSTREPTVREREARGRAWAWYYDACEHASRAWRDLCKEFASVPTAEITKVQNKTFEDLARLIDSAAQHLYFASGAFDLKQKDPGHTGKPVSLDSQRRFLTYARVAIDHLADAGRTPAAHHLVELLQAYIDADPELVFLTLGRIVTSSLGDGYQHESLGASVIVSIVERYLADYRDILRDHQGLLIEILDAFVNWPEARKLAYRLGEVFR